MAFFTRPDFDDRQFKQLVDATITLSGTTNFAGTLKSKGVEIDATTGGTASTGNVLTFDGTKISLLEPVGTASNILFDGQRSITRTNTNPSTVGNLNTTGLTQFIEDYFFPSVPPVMDIYMSSTTSREFGDSTDTDPSGDYVNWTVTKNTNTLTSIVVNGQSYTPASAVTTTSGGTTSYTATTAQYAPSTGTTQTSLVLSATVQTATEIDSDSITITWKHKRYWFKSTTKYNSGDDSLIQAVLTGGTLLGSELTTSKTKIFPTITLAGEYFYYAYPKHFGVPAFTINGLPNNGWGNSTAVPPTLIEFQYTNSKGYTETFYLASSDNKLSNSFNISVT